MLSTLNLQQMTSLNTQCTRPEQLNSFKTKYSSPETIISLTPNRISFECSKLVGMEVQTYSSKFMGTYKPGIYCIIIIIINQRIYIAIYVFISQRFSLSFCCIIFCCLFCCVILGPIYKVLTATLKYHRLHSELQLHSLFIDIINHKKKVTCIKLNPNQNVNLWRVQVQFVLLILFWF